jgi:DNA modification methylase
MSWRILEGDACDRLAELDAGSVQTCVTSPPYFGLRDYGTGKWEGGDEGCDHRAGSDYQSKSDTDHKGQIRGGPFRDAFPRPVHDAAKPLCGKCGAKRVDSQIGLESTPDEFVASLVAVFREVRRVLRDDGTLWLNLGDSYCSTDKWGGGKSGNSGKHTTYGDDVPSWAVRERSPAIPGVKPKDLLGIPWLVAFALRADGWYLRSEIIWAKPNPMPESVTDRPTRAHEQVFLLSKSPRYFYDADAIRVPLAANSLRECSQSRPAGNASLDPYVKSGKGTDGGKTMTIDTTRGANKRSVWIVSNKPYSGAHFATFPPSLIEPMVLAGAPVDGLVLDPFAGAGTTGVVALRRDRRFVGIELNPEYAALARNRIRDDAPLMNTVNEEAA